jgi:outer membrane protein assembly factor BamB
MLLRLAAFATVARSRILVAGRAADHPHPTVRLSHTMWSCPSVKTFVTRRWAVHVGLLLAAVTGVSHAATPWPEFRGPTGDGVSRERNLPITWSETDGIAYGTDDGDMKKGYSTAAFLTASGREQLVSPSAGATIAYEPTTGRELWRVRHGGMNASARPLFAHGLVYVNTASGGMGMLAVKPDGSGDVTGSHLAWKSSQGAGTRSSQLVVGDRLFLVANGGAASMLDALTGKPVWQKRLGGEFSASPILADGRIYACNQTGETFVISATEPHELLATNPLADGCMASPAVFDGSIYLRTKTHLYKIPGPVPTAP